MLSYHDQLVNIRRHLHQYPEEGWTEFTTTAFIVERLREFGYTDIRLGRSIINQDFCMGRDEKLVLQGIERARKNGVSEELLAQMQELPGCVAVFDTGRPGPTFGIRFDIDCVPVTESSDPDHIPAACGFASKNPGLMHACGHDAHTSMGLAVARWIMENKDSLNGKVKIIFQAAEEGVRGAAGVAASGIVDDVDYFLSSHVALLAKSGEMAVNLYGFLCTTKLDISFTGKASHAGASPEEGHNALAAACHATIQMLGISRHSEGMTRVNVGQMIAGEGRNVIPSTALLKVEVRGQTGTINQFMVDQVQNICEGVAKSFQVQVQSRKMGEAIDLTADPELTEILTQSGKAVPGLKVIETPLNFGASEDVTFLAKRVQSHGGKAAFFLWGSDRPGAHHSARFDINEADLDNAFAAWTQIIPRIMK